MRIGESLLETVRSLDQVFDEATLKEIFDVFLTQREQSIIDAIRSSDVVSPSVLTKAFGSDIKASSIHRGIDRLLSKLETALLGFSATGLPAPRVAHAHELWRRLAVADILMRTGARRTARKHFLAVLRSATLPEHAVLELYTLSSLMQEASYNAERTSVIQLSADVKRVMMELETLQSISRLLCIARTVVQRRREREAYSDPVIDECDRLLRRLETEKRTDRVTIEAARLAVIVAQYRVDIQLGTYWLREQRKSMKRSGIWNSSMRRENYTHELTLAGMVGDHKRALKYGNLLLEETKNGSAPWFTLIDFTTRALLLGGDSASAIPMLTAAFSHRQYRRLQPFLRNRLELSLGYAATLEEDAALFRTYSRRRTSRLQRGQQSFHDHVIDILQSITDEDSEPTIIMVKALAIQLKRLPASEQPIGALQLISNLNRTLTPLAKRGGSLAVEWIPGTPNTIVPWDLLWSWIRRRL